MIQIKVLNQYDHIEVSGHANYDKYGKDIVCASVSSIVITTVNAIIRLKEDTISYQQEDGVIHIQKQKEDNITDTLLENMLALLEELVNDYPKHIKIIKK